MKKMLFFPVVLRNSHPNATDDELTGPIKVWLAHAKERLNRVKELQKNMDDTH